MSAYTYKQEMTLCRTNQWNFGKITVTPRMLRILACVDGNASLGDIAEELSLTFKELCHEVEQLHEYKLVASTSVEQYRLQDIGPVVGSKTYSDIPARETQARV